LPRAWQLALAGVLLVAWMGPRHKLFEPALAMAAVYVAVLLLERPSPRRHLLAGVLAGFAGVMGKNHGAYALAAFLLLIVWLHWARLTADGVRSLGRDLLVWLGGIALGALPLLVMMAAVPGFLRAYLDSALFFVRQGQTNFGLPIPWPWVGSYAGLAWDDAIGKLALGIGFLLLLASPMVALLSLPAATGDTATSQRRALLLAGGVVGLFYMHHAFSRADSFHLCQGIHPALLALCGLPAALAGSGRRAAVAVVVPLLVFITLFAAVPLTPLYAELTEGREDPLDRFVPFRLGGDELRLPARTASLFAEIEYQIAALAPPGAPVLLIPHLPGLYPAIGRDSPISDFYPIWPAQGERDEKMLREIQAARVRLAVYTGYVRGEDPELLFPKTHPEVWKYLQANFERVPDHDLPRRVRLLRFRGGK
jgi:hypothetical protein